MKKLILILSLLLLSMPAFAQTYTRLGASQVIYTADNQPDTKAFLTVFKVIYAGRPVSLSPKTYRTDSSGYLLGDDGSRGIRLIAGAQVWLYANFTIVPGINRNPSAGTQYTVPASSATQLEELIYDLTLFGSKGSSIWGTTSGKPSTLAAGTTGYVLTADSAETVGAKWANPATLLAGTFQPLDSDLTAIAALSTTSFGRALLTEANAASLRTTLGLATVATSGSASDLGAGTLPDARFPSALPALNGSALTALNASNISSGSLALARIAQGGATSGQVLAWNGSQYAPTDASGGISGSGATNRLALWSGTSAQTSDADLSYSLDSLNAPNLNYLESFRALQLGGLSALGNGGSAGSGNLRLGDVTATLVADGRYNAFPGLTQLPDGRLLAVYRSATDHASADGVLKYQISTDQGRTWTAAATFYTPTSPPDARDTEVVVLRNGKLLLTFFDYDVTTESKARTLEGTISSTGAITWSAARNIAHPFVTTGTSAGAFVTSKALELPSGVILLPIYGKLSAGHTYASAVVVKSTDGGATWGSPVTVVSDPMTIDCNESNIVRLRSGRLVMITRFEGGSTGYKRSVSDDGGATWSSPTTVINLSGQLPGRPTLQVLPSGGILLFTRAAPPSTTGFAMSWDEGATWTAFDTSLSATNQLFEYSSTVLQSGGSIATIYSRETDSSHTAGNIYYQEIWDGYGLMGGGSVEAKILRSAGITTSAGNLGVKDTNPAYDITLGGTAARVISVGRAADNTGGSNLTVRAGGGASAWNNRDGGSLYLNSGISTGSGGAGNIYFQSYPAGSSGSSDNSAVTQMTLLGATGRLGLGISPTAKLHVLADSATTVGFDLKPAPSSSVPVQRWLDEDGNVRASVDWLGRFAIGQNATAATINGVADAPTIFNLYRSGAPGMELKGTSGARFFLTANAAAADQKIFEFLTDGATLKVSRLDDTVSTRTTYLTIANTGLIGIGTTTPTAKLQVANGDVYVSTIANGLVLKSPDGTCYRATMANGGTFSISSITCP